MTALTNNTTTAFTTAPANPNLIFEGVGSETEEANGMSCRMRTRLKSPTHGVIYLEIMAAYKGKYATQSVQNSPFEFHGVVMHATHENSDAIANRLANPSLALRALGKRGIRVDGRIGAPGC